jgi:putative SOS response-associated peptidase YedK
MPVILSKKDEKVWLDPALDITEAIKMLHPYPAEEMKMYPVSTLVNKPENDLPEVIKLNQEF